MVRIGRSEDGTDLLFGFGCFARKTKKEANVGASDGRFEAYRCCCIDFLMLSG